MEYGEFLPGITRLVNTFAPRWNADRESAYFQAFRNVSAVTWELMVARAVDTCERFPSPSVLKKQASTDDKRGSVWTITGCSDCEDGTVRFLAQANGIEYERYKACHCDAGDRVADHMQAIAKAKGRKDLTLDDMRHKTPMAHPTNT